MVGGMIGVMTPASAHVENENGSLNNWRGRVTGHAFKLPHPTGGMTATEIPGHNIRYTYTYAEPRHYPLSLMNLPEFQRSQPHFALTTEVHDRTNLKERWFHDSWRY